MAVIRISARLVGFTLALALLLAGALGFGLLYASAALPVRALELVGDRIAAVVIGLMGVDVEPSYAVLNVAEGPMPVVLAGGGVLLFVVTWFLTRSRGFKAASTDAAPDAPPPMDRSMRKRAEKQIKDLIKQGQVIEAAELCFTTDLLDQAVDLYVQEGDLLRAAEIRHDQNRFLDAAELYEKAGRDESAAAIYAEQDDPLRAGECFLRAGRNAMAAEMFEKAEEFERAGDCYAEAGFHRHAAQAFVRCKKWSRAAANLDEVVAEEGAKATAGADPEKVKEVRRLVLQAGKLHKQAGEFEAAGRVLERGGCFGPAAEIALEQEEFARAAELFQKAGDAPRAAEALRLVGDDQAADQILGEYHRDKGDDSAAAEAFEASGDLSAAGDLYRSLQEFEKAGACFERNNEPGAAAEMYRVAGDVRKAAECFEAAGKNSDAAECWAEAGEAIKKAEALTRAHRYLDAGQVYHDEGMEDDAIKVLQKVEGESGDLAAASALLGEIFCTKGMYSLSIKKLRQAIGDADLDQDNIDAFYTLASAYEASRQLREAVDLFEKILACDYHYADVEERLEAARDQLRLQEMNEPRTGVGGPPSTGSLTPSGGTRYQVVSELGRGGMGIVYKAQDTVLDREVAYKVLPDQLKENPQALKNFLREAKSAAQLNHPNIVTVYDAGEQDGRFYIAMEFVDGTTLKDILKRRGPIAPGGVIHVLRQMCEALAYAHGKKIVHRDIKTANAMWTRDKKAKIMDFGLAKVLEEVRNHTTLVSGTPYYMSPEQTLGRNVDHRTDLYSLGVTVFEMATGRLPFQEGNIPYHHVHTAPPDPQEVKPDLPEVIANVIRRCMQKDPDARYATAAEILTELKVAKAREA